MIGARFTPHHTHSLAVLVRVAAAMAFIATAVLIPVSLIGTAMHRVAPGAALGHVVIALAVTALVLAVARQLDPLRR